AGVLVRLREVVVAGDGSVVVRASQSDGTPGLFLVRGGVVTPFALLGDATDLGSAVRFSDASLRDRAEDGVFLGVREGLMVATASGEVTLVAGLGDVSPLRGRFAAFDPPAAGGGEIAFGASVQHGKSGEGLFTIGRHGAVTLVRTGQRAVHGTRLLDLFSDPIDDLTRPGVARGCVAFQALLGGKLHGSAILR